MRFNDKWLKEGKFSRWLAPAGNEAGCNLCSKTGERQVKAENSEITKG